MKRIFFYLFSFTFLFSCQTKEIKVIEEIYKNGATKKTVQYQLKGSDSIPLHEIQYHQDGSKYVEGSFIKGEREGEWMSWYPDGTVWSKGYFANGKRTGKSWVYHPNGQMYMKGEYLEGEKVGLWLVFDEQGNVVGQEDFSKKK